MAVVLKAEGRTSGGPKSHVRELRLAGRVPGVVYGGPTIPESISLDLKDVMKELRKPGFFNHLFDLECHGKTVPVLARDVHFHPVSDMPVHIDFMRVSADARVTVFVPVKFVNSDKSPGLKRGGLLNVVIHAIEMSVPAQAIPEQITIDLDGLNVGDAVHLSDLKLSKELRVLHPERDNTLATIVIPSGLDEPEKDKTEA